MERENKGRKDRWREAGCSERDGQTDDGSEQTTEIGAVFHGGYGQRKLGENEVYGFATFSALHTEREIEIDRERDERRQVESRSD